MKPSPKSPTPALLTVFVLVCLALSPMARAVSPAPDGGYPGENTAEGDDALFSLTAGQYNTAIGFNALYSNTTGISNTATGDDALYSNTTGSENTATGLSALGFNSTGFGNTATGHAALIYNTTGSYNTATGWDALFSNTSGAANTAIGVNALYFNTADGNTATGFSALESNADGTRNTATGVYALNHNMSGGGNTAVGYQALVNNTADGNTAIGNDALVNNANGFGNIALGAGAGSNLTTGNNNIDIGNQGVAAEANTIRVGTQGTQTNTYVAGIYQAMIPHGLAVVVDSAGHLGTKGSSKRFKEAIKPMDKASEAILKLKPVTFHYKKELDPEVVPQFGLVAEDVAKVNPDLIVRDDKGKIYTVRYDAVNAMLLNEFLKEHRKVEQLEKQVERLSAGLQKVSAQLELRKPSPRTVLNDQ
jgi:trimeric autotransporter adhesin